jgi:hypothetical protein
MCGPQHKLMKAFGYGLVCTPPGLVTDIYAQSESEYHIISIYIGHFISYLNLNINLNL